MLKVFVVVAFLITGCELFKKVQNVGMKPTDRIELESEVTKIPTNCELAGTLPIDIIMQQSTYIYQMLYHVQLGGVDYLVGWHERSYIGIWLGDDIDVGEAQVPLDSPLHLIRVATAEPYLLSVSMKCEGEINLRPYGVYFKYT